MSIIITANRSKRIDSAINNHLSGKLSYAEAFTAAKGEGLLGYLRNYKNEQKHSAVEKQFLEVLEKKQVNTALAGISKLNQITEDRTDEEIHIAYQCTFSCVNFENSNIKVSLADLHVNSNNNLEITITSHNKATNIDTTTRQTISVLNEQTRHRILAEYKIFKHRQFGAGELDVQNAPEADRLINEYKENQTKYLYDAICFSGGGAKGIAYSGVLEALGEYRLKHVKSVSGASAGAITAAMVAAGIKPYELTEFIGTKNLKLDQTKLRQLIKDQLRAIIAKRLAEYQTINTSSLSEEQYKLIAAYSSSSVVKNDITFNDLNQLVQKFPLLGFKNLFINAHLVHSSPPKEIELSHKDCPDMPISLAAVSSAALPIFFEPINATEFFSPPSKEKLGIKMESVYLNDGGIISNIPYKYLLDSSCTNQLIIAFEENKSLYNRSLSTSEKIKNYLAKAPVYIYRRADIYELEKKVQEPFYLNTQAIKTTSFKQAAKQFVVLNHSIKEDFIKYDIKKQQTVNGKTPITNKARDKTILSQLKFRIYPMYYNGSPYQKKVLESIYQDGKKYFEYLNEETDPVNFNKCYEQFNVAVDKLLKDPEFRYNFFLARV